MAIWGRELHFYPSSLSLHPLEKSRTVGSLLGAL